MVSFDVLVQPFYFDFMMRAFFIAILVAIPTSILSCFLVLKGWSLMGDAVAHAILPGVVIAYLIGFPYVIGAFLAGMLCAVTTGFLSENVKFAKVLEENNIKFIGAPAKLIKMMAVSYTHLTLPTKRIV